MTQTIHVPEGEAGDEAVKVIIPAIWRMAKAQQRRDRSTDRQEP